MNVAYLKSDYNGLYSKKLYGSSGLEVYIIQRSENMVLVIDKSDNKFWIHSDNLTLKKANDNDKNGR